MRVCTVSTVYRLLQSHSTALRTADHILPCPVARRVAILATAPSASYLGLGASVRESPLIEVWGEYITQIIINSSGDISSRHLLPSKAAHAGVPITDCTESHATTYNPSATQINDVIRDLRARSRRPA